MSSSAVRDDEKNIQESVCVLCYDDLSNNSGYLI